jgi:uncharacterized protein YbjT (DUF2867 family)
LSLYLNPSDTYLLADKINNWHIRAFTPNHNSYHAQQLLQIGDSHLELLKGDLNDDNSISVAIQGVYGVFCNTNFWSSGSLISIDC